MYTHFAVTTCPARECDRAVFLIVEDPGGHFFSGVYELPAEVHPLATSDYRPEGVPEQMATEFREAQECAWSGHYLGAALVGRRVLQAAARDVLGGRRNDLKTEIDDIPDERLNKALKDQAHQVRFIGNDAAHVDPVVAEEVNELLDFVEQVLEALYVGPAKVKRLQDARDARKATKSKPAKAPT
jgi:hypothetical protein